LQDEAILNSYSLMHFTKKQKKCSSICKFTHSPNTFRRLYFLQEDFARFYFLVKVTAKKVSINFTGDKGFHILILLSDHMLCMIEKSFTDYGCTRCSTIYWMTECLTGTFWLTDRDACTKPLNRDCPG